MFCYNYNMLHEMFCYNYDMLHEMFCYNNMLHEMFCYNYNILHKFLLQLLYDKCIFTITRSNTKACYTMPCYNCSRYINVLLQKPHVVTIRPLSRTCRRVMSFGCKAKRCRTWDRCHQRTAKDRNILRPPALLELSTGR